MTNEVIRAEDPAAVCTRDGWARWREARKVARSGSYGKDPGVANARFWAATARPATEGKGRTLFLECERWHDARKAAQLLLRAEAVDMAELAAASMRRKPARVQVRWEGPAASARLQVRRVSAKGKAGAWEDLA